MRIAMLAETFSPSVNGVVNSVRQVARELTVAGHDVTVVAPSGAAFDVGARSVPVVTVPAIPVPGYRGLRIARPGVDLTRTLHDLRPDVVHLASPAVLGQAGGRAARALGVPCVAVFQTDLAAFLRRQRAGLPLTAGSRERLARTCWSWLADVHGLADVTLAPSRASMGQLAERGIGPLRLWPRGVDGRLFHPVRRDPARHAAVSNGRLVVGVVARLASEKRLDLLAPLAARPDVALVVVGDGPERGRLQTLLPGATFLGQRTGADLAAWVASFDVFVHPGRDETFCQAVQEALASGVPTVAVAAGGPLDLVDDGRNGLLWDDEDPRTLATLVASLADPERRATFAAAARPSVAHRTWAAVTELLLDTYHDVVDRGATTRAITRRSRAA